MPCDYAIERYVRKESFELLNGLSPLERFSEKLKRVIAELDIEIKPEDEIVGRFNFDKKCDEEVVFDGERQTAEDERIITEIEKYKSSTSIDSGHTLVNYEEILNCGLAFYEKRIDAELEKYPQNEYLTAMKSAVASSVTLTKKASEEIDKRLCEDTEDLNRLEELKRIINKVPYKPAESFREAVQSVWIIHFLTPLSGSAWYSISLGRFDEYMYPFYKKSLNNGMTRDEAKKILHNFYKLLNGYSDGACLLNIGPDYNELSELITECQKEFALPAPILGARVDENTPDSIWNALIDEKLFSMGQPTFYGETACIRALTEKGLSKDETAKFSNNSCMGIAIPGNEFNSMWGCVFSVCTALEAALNNGKCLSSLEVPVIPNISAPSSTEELFSNFESCAKYILDIGVKSYEKRAEVFERVYPNPFISLLMGSCIEKHCDRTSGAEYHNVTVECMGMINAADGIYAVDRLVFKENKYTLEEINRAVADNFVGYENIRNDILKCPKFGQNTEADGYAVRVAEILQKIIRSYDHGNMYYSPSLHTLDTNVWRGMELGAGYDGRYAGTPLAKNAGPSNIARSAEPTSMILSSSALPQHKFYGGQPIDVNFTADTVRSRKDTVKTLIMTYHNRGGLQFQVNSLSSKLLRDATDNPEKYPNLVVRIGGYSIYFNNISRESKEEFIERFEKEGY